MKNNPTLTSQGRQPRSIVRINGVVFTGVVSWEVENNRFAAPDTYRLTLAVSKLPSANGPAWFASQTPLTVEILVGFPANPDQFDASEMTSLILGDADTFDWEVFDYAITLAGRDKSAPLLDTKASEKYPNLTASQIAAKLAQKYGLTPVVTATSTKAGKYYEIDHVRMQDERTEWDLLQWLAREEQFVCYVNGDELHFEPEPKASQDPYVFQYTPATATSPVGFNGQTLCLTRTMTIARGVTVTVQSWNHKQKKTFSRKASFPGGGGKNPQQYSYVIGGLTPDQAQQRANQILAEISKHAVKLKVTGPADNLLLMTDVIKVSGTSTALDQVFYPDVITREFDVEDGYHWTVEAKNQSPQSEPTL